MFQNPSNDLLLRRSPTDPMPAAPVTSSARLWLLALLTTLTAAAIAALTIGGSSSIGRLDFNGDGQPLESGSGVLVINGETYTFTTENCLVTDDDFIASGTGSASGEPFRIAASISSFELAFGTNEELVEPTAGSLWLRSIEPPVWQSQAETVSADVSLVDPLNPQSPVFRGRLQLDCPSDQDE